MVVRLRLRRYPQRCTRTLAMEFNLDHSRLDKHVAGEVDGSSSVHPAASGVLEQTRVVRAMLNYGIALTAEAKAWKIVDSSKIAAPARRLLTSRICADVVATVHCIELEPAILNTLSAAWQVGGERERALQFEELSVAALVSTGKMFRTLILRLHCSLAVALKQYKRNEEAIDTCTASLEMMNALDFTDSHPAVRLVAGLLDELSSLL